MKTNKLLTILTIVSVVLIAGCKKDEFIEIAVECPAVESASPANGVAGIPLNPAVSVTFNENMFPESCNAEAAFTLEGNVPVAGTVSYNGKTATFTPTDKLLPGTTYIATISTAFKNQAGIPLSKKYVWSFTTVEGNDVNVVSGENLTVK